jgi:hypothetical protein
LRTNRASNRPYWFTIRIFVDLGVVSQVFIFVKIKVEGKVLLRRTTDATLRLIPLRLNRYSLGNLERIGIADAQFNLRDRGLAKNINHKLEQNPKKKKYRNVWLYLRLYRCLNWGCDLSRKSLDEGPVERGRRDKIGTKIAVNETSSLLCGTNTAPTSSTANALSSVASSTGRERRMCKCWYRGICVGRGRKRGRREVRVVVEIRVKIWRIAVEVRLGSIVPMMGRCL